MQICLTRLKRIFLIGWIGYLLFTSCALANEPAMVLNPVKPHTDSLIKVRVQFNWHHQFQFAGFYAALQQGYYQNAGLDVELMSWQPGISPVEKVINGEAEFAIGYSSLLVDLAKGKPIELVFSSFQYSPLILLSHFPVTDLKRLANKTVMHNAAIQVESLIANSGLAKKRMPEQVPSSGNLNDFINGKVDFYGAYISNEPYILQKHKIPFYIVDPKKYGVQSYAGLTFTTSQFAMTQPALVDAFRKATIRGWKYAVKHPQEVIDGLLKNYPVTKTETDLLNEAKALKPFVKTGNTPIGHINRSKVLGILADTYQLQLITKEEYEQARLQRIIFKPERHIFTKEEQQYLKQNPRLVVNDSKDLPPFQFVDNRGQTQGLVTEYLSEIEKNLGIQIERKTQMPADNKQPADLIPAITETPALREKYLFTRPYLSFPLVLIGTGENSGFINDFSALSGYKLAVRQGSFPERYFQLHYPNIQLLKVGSVREGLEAVQSRKVIALADNLVAINYAVRNMGFTNLQIIGQTERSYEFSMAVDKNNPVLLSIIQKTLDKIDLPKRQQIYQKWLHLPDMQTLNYQRLWQFLLPLILVIFLLVTILASYHRRQRYLNEIYELSYATFIDAKTLKITWSSESFCKLSGYSRDELSDMPYLNLASPAMSDKQVQSIYHQTVELGQTWNGEIPAIKKNGEEYWVDLTLTPNKNYLGKVNSVLATRIDISNRKKIEEISVTDELTGLYNRRFFQKKLDSEIRRAKREMQKICFIMLDLDFFKKINDDYGHQIGDEVLIEVATSVHAYFNRENDFVFRIGGEEFFIISYFESLKALQVHLNNLVESIRVQKIENLNAPLGYLTLSLGVLYCDSQCIPSAEKVLKRTDDLLYLSKTNGRNQMTMDMISRQANTDNCVKKRVNLYEN